MRFMKLAHFSAVTALLSGYVDPTQAQANDPLRIVCKADAVGMAPRGGQGTVTVVGPIAQAFGGVPPVTIQPDVTEAITVTGTAGTEVTFTYIATDANGNTATDTITLRITEECGDDDLCGDPHMKGLRGQSINWSGIDGGWYCLIKDDELDLQVNVRLTAPLPDDFPDRQLITGLSIMSEGHSLAIEVKNPYDIGTDGCPYGISPCLANGGLRAVVDEEEVVDLLRFSRVENVADGISLSASNLPVECRKFGGDKIWARMYEKMLQDRRRLATDDSFEDWILTFHNMAAPDWCAKFILENDLSDLQSAHAIFKIETSTVTVRLNVGVNYQVGGELDWDGRVLPDLEFWQMDVGLDGLLIENPTLSGILGETARPVLDENGREVMEGFEAFRGTAEDYRVSSSLGTHFALLDKSEKAHM